MVPRKSITLLAVGAGLGASLTALIMWAALKSSPVGKEASSTNAPKSVAQTEPKIDEAPALPSFTRDISGDCTLSGVVLNAKNTPVEGAQVGIWLADQPWSSPQPGTLARTGRDGRFRIEKINGGIPMLLWATASGYASESAEAPKCNQPEEVVLKPGGSLVVRVTDGENRPVPGAEVRIDSLSHHARKGYTDPKGQLRIDGLAEASYEVFVRKNDSAYLSPSPVEVTAGISASTEALLEKVDKRTVRVLHATKGSPLKDALIVFVPSTSSSMEIAARTDAAGRATILCPTASCVVWAAADRFIFSEKFPLDPGETIIRLTPGGTIRGRVVDKQGTPIPGATLSVSDHAAVEEDGVAFRRLLASADGAPPLVPAQDGNTVFFGPPILPRPGRECALCAANDANPISDETGQFALTGLPIAPLSLTAFHPMMIPQGPPLKISFNENGEFDDAVIVMKLGAKITLRVLDDREVPVLGASTAVFDDDGRIIQNGLTDTDGYVHFTGLPSGVRMEVSAEDHITRVIHTDNLGKEAELEVTLEPALKRLHGRVKDSRGFGIGNVAVTARLLDRGKLQTLTAVSGTDGTFFLEGAGEGRYHVIADGGDQGGAQVLDVTYRDDIKLVLDMTERLPTIRPQGEGVPVLIEPDMQGGARITEIDGRITDIDGEIANNNAMGADNLGVSAGSVAEQPIVVRDDDEAPPDSPEALEPPAADAPSEADAPSAAMPSAMTDPLPVTGPPPGKGGLPIDVSGGPGKVTVTRVGVGSRVEIAGLRKGARILTVDGKKVSGPADAKRALMGSIGSVVMLEVSDNPDGTDPYTIIVQRERVP